MKLYQFVFLQRRERKCSIFLPAGQGDGVVSPDSARRLECPLDLDLDVRHRRRAEVGGLRMARDVDEIHQGAILLPHQSNFHQRMRIRFQLPPLRQELIDQIPHQSGVRLGTMLVIQATQVPGQPRDFARTVIFEDQARRIRVFPSNFYQFRRSIERRRNQCERTCSLNLQIVAVEERDVDTLQRETSRDRVFGNTPRRGPSKA